MSTDAIRALGDVGHCDGDQLLGLHGKRPFGEHATTERFEGLGRLRSKARSLLGEFLGRLWVNLILLEQDSKLLSELGVNGWRMLSFER